MDERPGRAARISVYNARSHSSVLPAQLKNGTETSVVNGMLTSYSLVRQYRADTCPHGFAI